MGLLIFLVQFFSSSFFFVCQSKLVDIIEIFGLRIIFTFYGQRTAGYRGCYRTVSSQLLDPNPPTTSIILVSCYLREIPNDLKSDN
jgi:hypothetical protein